jgi:hypothetical protein
MQDAKKWLFAALLVALVGGATVVLNLPSPPAAQAQPVPAGDHWRNFDGHWSYWHEADHRWYYTDGTHWYYHNGIGWAVYEFDKLFGRGPAFIHGDYHAPGPEIKVVPPRHDIFRHL